MAMTYTITQVRNFILFNQGLFFEESISSIPNRENIIDSIRRMGVIQIDSINVVDRSQYLTLWSRIGIYNKDDFDEIVYSKNRIFFEYWFHCASIIPLDIYKYRLYKMNTYKNNLDKWSNIWLSNEDNVLAMNQVLDYVNKNGKVSSIQFNEIKPEGGWWNRKPTKIALEQLYNRGDLMVTERKNFNRIYDITKRVLPEWVDIRPVSEEESYLFLLEYSAKCLGIFFLSELGDYFYSSKEISKKYVSALVKSGQLISIKLENIKEEMYIHIDKISEFKDFIEKQIIPQKTTLISPFDCIFWNKKRNKYIFNFEHTFEAYKKEEDRKWGYYNMPILYKGNFVGRVDPKVDRISKTLTIKNIYLEDGFIHDNEFEDNFLNMIIDFMKFNKANSFTLNSSSDKLFKKYFSGS